MLIKYLINKLKLILTNKWATFQTIKCKESKPMIKAIKTICNLKQNKTMQYVEPKTCLMPAIYLYLISCIFILQIVYKFLIQGYWNRNVKFIDIAHLLVERWALDRFKNLL